MPHSPLIVSDEEELAFRIERLNAVAMRELKKVAGRSRRVQQQQMKELKAWLRSHLGRGEDDIVDLVEDELGRCETRLRDSDGNTVDAMSYIRRPVDQDPDDSDSEDDEDADSAEEVKAGSPQSAAEGAKKEVLVLSDSDDGSDDDDDDGDNGAGAVIQPCQCPQCNACWQGMGPPPSSSSSTTLTVLCDNCKAKAQQEPPTARLAAAAHPTRQKQPTLAMGEQLELFFAGEDKSCGVGDGQTHELVDQKR